MNRIFKIKWNGRTQRYAVCSELSKCAGKITHGSRLAVACALFMGLTPAAQAAECSVKTRLSGSCEITGRAVNDVVGWQAYYDAYNRANVQINGDLSLDLNTSSRYTDYGSTGIGVTNQSTLTAADTVNVKIRPETGNKNISVFGMQVWSGGQADVGQLNVDIQTRSDRSPTFSELIRGSRIESYGVQVGTGIIGEDRLANEISRVKVRDANITVAHAPTTVSDGMPYQLTGIRVIRNEDLGGSKPIFESTGKVSLQVADDNPNSSLGYVNGIYVSGVDSKVVLNDSDIAIGRGANGTGLRIGKTRQVGTGGSLIESNGAMKLTTSDNRAVGVRLIGSNNTFKANASNSRTTIEAAGVAVMFGADDLGIRDTNASNQQVLLKDADISTTSTGSLGVVEAKNRVANATLTLTGNQTNVRANDKTWLMNVTDRASLTVNASEQGQMSGLTSRASGSNLTVNLDNGFTWYLREHDNVRGAAVKQATLSELNLSHAAVLDAVTAKTNGASDFTVSGNVKSTGGIINLANDRFNDVLTINGDYTGNGGILKVNTHWDSPGHDDGRNSSSDKLIIARDARGTTTVHAVKADGTPDVIDGSIGSIAADLHSNSAVVVEVRGTDHGSETGTTAGTPSYPYRTTFTGEARTTGAGLLRLASRQVGGVTQYFWTLSAMNTNTTNYDSVVSAYALAAKTGNELGYTTLATLHERRDENQILAWDNLGENQPDQSWVRILGRQLDVAGQYRLGAEHRIQGLQVGHDFAVRRTDEGGHRLTGLYLGYTSMNSHYSDALRTNAGGVADPYTGSSTQRGWYLGATHTRYASNGAYLDLVGQLGFLRHQYTARNGVSASQNGTALALSVEAGRPYVLNDKTIRDGMWQLEPQAQLVYQILRLQGFHDGSKTIAGDTHHGLRGRLGARLAYSRQNADKPQTHTFYATANLLHDFTQGSAVQIGLDSIKENHARTWLELGLGGQLPLGKQSHLYADVRYEHSLSRVKHEGLRGTVGLKYTW